MFSGWTAPVGWALSSRLPPANSRKPLRAQVLEGRGHLCHTRRRHAGVGLEPGVDSVGRGTGQPAEKLWQVGASKGHRSHCRWGAKAGRGRRWGGVGGEALPSVRGRSCRRLTGGRQRRGSCLPCSQQRPSHLSPHAPAWPLRLLKRGTLRKEKGSFRHPHLPASRPGEPPHF